jgi:hypothetical protein
MRDWPRARARYGTSFVDIDDIDLEEIALILQINTTQHNQTQTTDIYCNMSHSIASALAEKDTNQQPFNTANHTTMPGDENKTVNTDQQKQALDKKIAEHNNSSGTYISPSDAILSPASSKLAGFKQRQINKQ